MQMEGESLNEIIPVDEMGRYTIENGLEVVTLGPRLDAKNLTGDFDTIFVCDEDGLISKR